MATDNTPDLRAELELLKLEFKLAVQLAEEATRRADENASRARVAEERAVEEARNAAEQASRARNAEVALQKNGTLFACCDPPARTRTRHLTRARVDACLLTHAPPPVRTRPTGKSLLDYGLPPMPREPVGTDTPASESAQHLEARIIPSLPGFGLVSGLRDRLTRADTGRIWAQVSPGQSTLPDYASEADAVLYMNSVLRDVGGALRPVLGSLNLSFVSELSVFGDKADLWVMRSGGVPVGVVEMKKPGRRNAVNSASVAGQIFDYMQRLRSFHGLDHVFGIVATYREWRIFWLADTDAAAVATEMPMATPEMVAATAAARASLLPAIPAWEVGDAGRQQDPAPTPEVQPQLSPTRDRVVRAGPVMEWNDPQLVDALASVLYKMATSPATRLPRQLIEAERRLYILARPTQWLWVRLPSDKPLELRYWPMPRADATQFLLLLHLGDGTFSRAWLACTFNGAACVLKFPRASSDGTVSADALRREAAIWRTAWGVAGVRIQTLVGKDTLVLPYVRTCSGNTAAAQTDEVRLAAREAARRMAERGWRHDDLHWRHVGLYRDGGGRLCALFIDLGLVSEVATEERGAAEAHMLAQLELAV